MTTIDKDIPMPSAQGARGRPVKYPVRDLQVGESFYMATPAEAANCRNAITAARKTHPERRFTVRQFGDGYRCWRLE